MRTKICGITRPEDAEAAALAGAWAVGLNHWEGSPRRVEHDAAEEIGTLLKRRCEVVGVFVNASLDEVARAAEREQLTMVQFHGDEGQAFIREAARRTGCRTIKAHRVRSQAEVRGASAFGADFDLFDAHRTRSPGGTGESFDWELIAGRRQDTPAILAGGLSAANVAAAIAAGRPDAVDVATGVELEPGIKSEELIAEFIAEANRAGVLLNPAQEVEA